MFGFPDHNEPVKEPFASQIRDKLRRYAIGDYTEEELQEIEKSKKILSQYKAIWVD